MQENPAYADRRTYQEYISWEMTAWKTDGATAEEHFRKCQQYQNLNWMDPDEHSGDGAFVTRWMQKHHPHDEYLNDKAYVWSVLKGVDPEES